MNPKSTISSWQLCEDCISGKRLTAEFDLENSECTNCGSVTSCASAESLINTLQQVLETYFKPAFRSDDEYDETYKAYSRRQLFLSDILVELLPRLNRKTCDTLVRQFEDDKGNAPRYHRLIHPAYDDWMQFVDEVLTRSRFFSTRTYDILNDYFKTLSKSKILEKFDIVRVISTNDYFPIFRARSATSVQSLSAILKAPGLELSAPPDGLGGNGRINAEGVSLFYGSSTKATAIGELVPEVGHTVVVAEFELVRAAKLIDLVRLESRCREELKALKDNYSTPACSEIKSVVCDYELWRMYSFFLYYINLMKFPVPKDSSNEYIITQVISEFLSEQFDLNIDGVMYHSVQKYDEQFADQIAREAKQYASESPWFTSSYPTSKPEAENDPSEQERFNVAFFQRSKFLDEASYRLVGPAYKVDLRGSLFAVRGNEEIFLDAGNPDNYRDRITMETRARQLASQDGLQADDSEQPSNQEGATLRIKPSSIEAFYISGVKYQGAKIDLREVEE